MQHTAQLACVNLLLLLLIHESVTIAIITSQVLSHRPNNRKSALGLSAHIFLLNDNVASIDDLGTSGSGAKQTTGAWVPVTSTAALFGLDPFRVRIMGRDYVVWTCESRAWTRRRKGNILSKHPSSEEKGKKKETRDDEMVSLRKMENRKGWSVSLDACPNCFAPLSRGRVDLKTGCLLCPSCHQHINRHNRMDPINENDGGSDQRSLVNSNKKPAENAERFSSTTSMPVHVTGDLIWAFMPTEVHGERFPRELLPEDYYQGLAKEVGRDAKWFVCEVPGSYDFVMENGIDPSHLPFTHHNVMAKRSDAGAMPMTMVESNFTHLEVYASYVRNGKARERIFSIQRPFQLTNRRKVNEKNEWSTAASFFVVPVEEGMSRIITSYDTSLPIPTWIVHNYNMRFFDGDLWLYDAERNVRINPKSNSTTPEYLYATSADVGVKAWRMWLVKYGLANSPPHTFGPSKVQNLPPKTRMELSNRWHRHTSTCATCRAVLRRSKRVRFWALVLGIGGGAVLRRTNHHPLWAALTVMGGLLCSAVAKRAVESLGGSVYASDLGDRSYSVGSS